MPSYIARIRDNLGDYLEPKYKKTKEMENASVTKLKQYYFGPDSGNNEVQSGVYVSKNKRRVLMAVLANNRDSEISKYMLYFLFQLATDITYMKFYDPQMNYYNASYYNNKIYNYQFCFANTFQTFKLLAVGAVDFPQLAGKCQRYENC